MIRIALELPWRRRRETGPGHAFSRDVAVRKSITVLHGSSRSSRSSTRSRLTTPSGCSSRSTTASAVSLGHTHAATSHSKRGRLLTRFGEFPDQVRDELRSRDAILDGEILAVDPEGRADFRLLMRSLGSLHFAAFDLLWLNGQLACGRSRWSSESAAWRS